MPASPVTIPIREVARWRAETAAAVRRYDAAHAAWAAEPTVDTRTGRLHALDHVAACRLKLAEALELARTMPRGEVC